MAEINTTSEDPRTSAIRIQLEAIELVRVIRQTFIAQDVYLDGRRRRPRPSAELPLSAGRPATTAREGLDASRTGVRD
jgi:hypothetical protein